LQSRLADYRNVLEGASPREAAYKITQLKGKLEAIKGVPRDENTNSVVFDRMTIAGHLDQASHVEFKNLVLAFVGLDGFSQTRQGRTLVNAQFSIGRFAQQPMADTSRSIPCAGSVRALAANDVSRACRWARWQI
jgi:hypothetical protein